MTTHVNPLRRVHALGQSVWLDYIRRSMLSDGTLARFIAEDGLAGMTSNPVIFEKAIAHGAEYESAIAALAPRAATPEIYESLVVEDVQMATDVFQPLYAETRGLDGYVSLEVSPHLADDTAGTVAEAHHLWERVDRPNVMIKVPGTRAGLDAIAQLIGAGINVNVTLLFSVSRYAAVVEAWLSGLETRVRAGQPVAGIASVASFFLSRIDTLVDGRLDQVAAQGQRRAASLRGRAATACARLAYRHFLSWYDSERWRALAAHGAMPQRLLWASTSTKDPAYPDVKYVEPLIGPRTVNTMPLETLEAYRDHGDPQARIEDDWDEARALPGQLAALTIDLEQVAQQLEREGVRKFVEPFDSLIATIESRRMAALSR